jgi:hypothetical protein
MWLDRCPSRLGDVERAVGDLQRATDACAVIVNEGAKFRESRMGANFTCEKDLRDLLQQMNTLDGFDLPALTSPDTVREEKSGHHIEACVNDMIIPLYERIVPESIRSRPPAVQLPAGAQAQKTPSRSTSALIDDERQVTPVLFDNLNRLLSFKSIDLPTLDIRIREHTNSIDLLRKRMRVFKEDCGE